MAVKITCPLCATVVLVAVFVATMDTPARAVAEEAAAIPFRVAWATRVKNPPTIDGKLTLEDGWETAPALVDFTLYHAEGTPAHTAEGKAEPTEARLLYDDKALYVAMRLDGPGRGALDAKTTQRDGGIGSNDCAHVFLAPPDSPALEMEPQVERAYFHLTVNAIGTQRDAVGYKGVVWWNGEWSAKTFIRDDGWDLEMRIPFDTLGVAAPKREPWVINICRRYSTKDGARLSHWSPVEYWYNFPRRFGRVVFGKGKPRDEEIALRFVQRNLGAGLSTSEGGLKRARRDLGFVPEERPGRDALLDGLGPLWMRTKAIRKRVGVLEPTAAAEARVKMTKEVDELSADTQAAERAAHAMRLREQTPANWPFIVLGGPAITNERFDPGMPFPPSFYRTDRLSVVACRGEYEPVTFVLYSAENRTDVTIRITDLKGPAGTLPADAVDIHVIKYWFQAGEKGGSPELAAAGGVLVPELLMKDDGLVVVDRERRKNFMRTEDGLVDISDPAHEFGVEGDPIVESPRLMKIAPKDADELQSFNVPADGIKQIFVTVLVPTDAGAGTYVGEIHVDAPGAGSLALPLSVEVLPFDLAPAPIDYSLYTRGRLVDHQPVVPVWSDQKTEEQYRAELKDLFAHGIVNPNVVEVRFENFVRVMRMREEVGMPKGHIYSRGQRIHRDELDSDEAIEKFKSSIRPFVKWARENGYGDFYVYGVDEADRLLPKERRWIEAAHEMGAKVFVSVEDDGRFLPLAGDILDLPILSGPPSPSIVRRVHRNGHRIGVYESPQVNWEKPETFRRHYGIRLWQAGYDVAMTYAYQHSFGHIWNDFDFRGFHKDYNFTYPTVDGVVDTLCFEGMREAVDDTRYVATLLLAAAEAKKDPTRQAQADADEKWIGSISTQGDLENLRREIIARILALMR